MTGCESYESLVCRGWCGQPDSGLAETALQLFWTTVVYPSKKCPHSNLLIVKSLNQNDPQTSTTTKHPTTHGKTLYFLNFDHGQIRRRVQMKGPEWIVEWVTYDIPMCTQAFKRRRPTGLEGHVCTAWMNFLGHSQGLTGPKLGCFCDVPSCANKHYTSRSICYWWLVSSCHSAAAASTIKSPSLH